MKSYLQIDRWKKIRGEKSREYIVFSYTLSFLLLGMMFKDILFPDYNDLILNDIIIITIFCSSVYFFGYCLKNIRISLKPVKRHYAIFAFFIFLITFLISKCTSYNVEYLKIYYILPVILASITYGQKLGLFTAFLATGNLIILNWLHHRKIFFEFDIIIMIMIFWIFWLVGGISDLERKLQDFFKKTAKERARSLRIISALVSRLQETNQELKKSQKLFRLNFEKAGIGIAICRPDGSIIKANSALGKMLGFSQDKLKDIKLAELARKDETKLNSTLNTLLSGPESHTVLKMKYYNRSGKPIWVKQNLTLARENGQPSYFLIHVEDITEKKQAEMEIKTQREKLEYNRLKTRFFSRMSHELKTLLNLIFTSMHMLDNNRKKLLQNNRETEKMFDKYLGILEQNSYHLLRLINNVIDLTKIDSKSFDIEPVNCNLSSLTAKVINSVRKYVESKNRRLQYDCNSEKIITACDPASIERIILNLLSNAIKFTVEGDKIKVTLTKKNNLIKLHVSDTGIGIEKEKQDIIFDHFRQVDESFTRQEEGSGTGLPLVKSLVELHKGNIEVVSTYGKGSVFTITLPQKILPHTSTKDYLPSDNLINKYNLEFADLPG